jgi:hypothetical protein
VCVLVGVGVIGIRAAQAAPPSGTHAAGCDLAGHQVIVSALCQPSPGFASLLHVWANMLSWCAHSLYVSFLCVPPSGLRIAVDFRVHIIILSYICMSSSVMTDVPPLEYIQSM